MGLMAHALVRRLPSVDDGSGLPMARRRTFATGILPFAPSMAAALSASCLRLPPTPSLGTLAAPHGFIKFQKDGAGAAGPGFLSSVSSAKINFSRTVLGLG
jgi:hypothetical protein